MNTERTPLRVFDGDAFKRDFVRSGLTVRDLAFIVDASKPSVQAWLDSRVRSPHYGKLRRAQIAFNNEFRKKREKFVRFDEWWKVDES